MHHADVEGKVPQLETAHAVQMQVDALVHVRLHGSQSGLYFIGDLGRGGGELLRAEEAVDRSGYVSSSDVDVHLAHCIWMEGVAPQQAALESERRPVLVHEVVAVLPSWVRIQPNR